MPGDGIARFVFSRNGRYNILFKKIKMNFSFFIYLVIIAYPKKII
jgi:hypothetical protein